VLLSGLTGALTYVIARRLAGIWIALGAWGLWTVSPETLDWHSSYFSETTTSVLWLSVLLALMAWRDRERAWLLAAIVGGVAWMGITRPVTGIALGIPIAIVVMVTAWQRRSLVGFKRSAIIGALICAIVPYWSWTTIGSSTRLPYAEYSAWYFPFDMPGFVRDTSPPLRELSPDYEALASSTRKAYNGHVPSAMPSNFVTRAYSVARHSLGPIAEPLMAMIPLGMVALGGGVSLFAAASFALLVAAYLVMPHANGWTIYYLEIFPLVPLFAMAGFAWFAQRARDYATERKWSLFTPSVLRGAAVLVPALLIVATARRIPARQWHETMRSSRQQLARVLIADLPDPRAVVFVRRTSPMSPHFTLWDVLGDPATTPTWIVRDLGDARNAELVALAGERKPYLLDEAQMTLTPYNP
jgi:4-amino-4-deoxy-L-arabinose transferase-like glycosyltransferase